MMKLLVLLPTSRSAGIGQAVKTARKWDNREVGRKPPLSIELKTCPSQRVVTCLASQIHCQPPASSAPSDVEFSIITEESLATNAALLNSLCSVANDVIDHDSGIGWTTPFDDPLELLPYFTEQAKSKNVHLVVAHVAHEAIGSLQVCDSIGKDRSQATLHRAEISCFFVGSKHRQKGMGSQLLLEAETVARGLGISKLTLDCRSTQHSAIRLYERSGYNRWGTMDNYASADGRKFHAGYFYDKDIK